MHKVEDWIFFIKILFVFNWNIHVDMAFQSLFEATVELAWSYMPADAITCSIKLLENVGRILYTLIHKVRFVLASPARIENFTKDLL